MKTELSTEFAITDRIKDWPLPSLDLLKELCHFEGPCVTIYLAEHLPGSESKSSLLHLRARIDQAADLLREHFVAEEDVKNLLAPLRTLEQFPELHRGHKDGLVLLRSPQALRYFRLPQFHRNAVFVGEHLQILPMLTHLSSRPSFYLLKLSRKACSLLHVDLSESKAVELPESVTCDYELFKSLDQPDHMLRARSGLGTGSGSMSPVSFGTSSGREKEMDHFHDFCRAIDRGLYPMLVAKAEPLVIAGTEAEVSAYQRANRYQLLVNEGVYGSPEGGASDAEMVQSARKLLSGWNSPDEERVIRLYKDLEGTSKSLVELNAIVAAAAQGRVEKLLVAEGAEANGNYDAITNRTLLSGSFTANHVDLVNAAVSDTLLHGGAILSMGKPEDRIDSSVAAILRF